MIVKKGGAFTSSVSLIEAFYSALASSLQKPDIKCALFICMSPRKATRMYCRHSHSFNHYRTTAHSYHAPARFYSPSRSNKFSSLPFHSLLGTHTRTSLLHQTHTTSRITRSVLIIHL
ncbi:GSCOCG00003971001-RA-CDS [Cotesia congregata]|nr:GSCOCG00003971001-RA-CDS [Cotesia congregata]